MPADVFPTGCPPTDAAPRPSLRDIARVAGCHYSTVSLALRDNPTIPAATRKRIRAVADRLGYKPDAMLAALSAYRLAKRPSAQQPVLGWCTNYPTRDQWRELSCKSQYFDGARARAEERGYRLEHFWLAEPGMTGRRMSDILRSRGISGLLLAPQPHACALELEWSEFSAVTLGYTLLSPKLHLIYHHDSRMMSQLLAEVAARGYRRVGLLELREHDERVEHSWLAAYLAAQTTLPNSARLAPLILDGWDEARVLKWVAHERPDAIVTKLQPVKALLERAGYRVPADIGLAFHSSVDLPGPDELTGMRKNAAVVGRMAVDFLVAMLHRNERGVPEIPQRLLIEGSWTEGRTLRPRLPARREPFAADTAA